MKLAVQVQMCRCGTPCDTRRLQISAQRCWRKCWQLNSPFPSGLDRFENASSWLQSTTEIPRSFNCEQNLCHACIERWSFRLHTTLRFQLRAWFGKCFMTPPHMLPNRMLSAQLTEYNLAHKRSLSSRNRKMIQEQVPSARNAYQPERYNTSNIKQRHVLISADRLCIAEQHEENGKKTTDRPRNEQLPTKVTIASVPDTLQCGK